MDQQAATEQKETIPTISWFLLGLLALVWGSSYILIKKGLVAFEPEQLACLRISISSIAFLPLFLMRIKEVDWSKFKYLIIIGLSGSGIPAFLFAIAQTEISSSVAGVLSSLTPLFTLVWGITLFGVPMVWSKVLGVIIGLAGAISLIVFGSNAGLDGNMWYGLLIVLGCALYALSVNTVKTYLQDMSAITISAVSFFIIGIPAAIYLFTTDFLSIMQNHEAAWISLGYVAILALFGTVLATILFFKLVQLTNAVFSSMVSYLIPIVALFWGAVDQETISSFHYIGMMLILLGVYISKK